MNLSYIKTLTTRNDHNTAYIEACMLLWDEFGEDASVAREKLLPQFEKIRAIQEQMGYLPNEEYERRFALYQQMMDIAKGLMDEETYQQFYMSF